jgi:hypothetical protein
MGDTLRTQDQLVLKEDGVRIAISLSGKSVNFLEALAAGTEVEEQIAVASIRACRRTPATLWAGRQQ